MSRGTRALHEVGGFDGAGSSDSFAHFIREHWLATHCWCDTAVVMIPRVLVLDGVTGTCGRAGCDAPPGTTPVVQGPVVTQRNGGWMPVERGAAWRRARRWTEVPVMNDAEVERNRRDAFKPYGLAGRPRDPDVALRRDMVAGLIEQGRSRMDIAVELDVPYYIVNMDVQLLNRRARLDGK